MKKSSGFLSLDIQDFIKGLIVAILAPIVVLIEQTLETGSLHFDWRLMGISALAAGLAYLSKNLLTPSNGVKDVVGTRPDDR